MSCAGSSPRASLFARLDRFLLPRSCVRLLPPLGGGGGPSPSLSAGRESTAPSLRARGRAGRPERRALDPLQRRAERDGGGSPSRTRSPGPSGARIAAGPSGRGAGWGVLFPPGFGTRARAGVHTGSQGRPARCGAAGLTVVTAAVLARSFFPGALQVSAGAPTPTGRRRARLSPVWSAVTGNRRGSFLKEADTPTLPPERGGAAPCVPLPPRKLRAVPETGAVGSRPAGVRPALFSRDPFWGVPSVGCAPTGLGNGHI